MLRPYDVVRHPPQRIIEQLDRVYDRYRTPQARQPRTELQQAPRIPGDDHVGVGREAGPDLAIAQVRGGARLDEIEDPGRAAAQRGVRDLHQLHLRDGAQQTTGLQAHVLRVLQVAGIVIRHAQRRPQRLTRRPGPELRAYPGAVGTLGREPAGAARVCRVSPPDWPA